MKRWIRRGFLLLLAMALAAVLAVFSPMCADLDISNPALKNKVCNAGLTIIAVPFMLLR